MRDFLDAVRRHLSFSRQEWVGLIVTTLVFAVIASFTQWGGTAFDAAEGVRNLAIAIIICGTGVFIHHLGQKLAAIRMGLTAEIKVWWYGLLGGLLITLISNGAAQVYVASGVFIHHLPIQRLGRFRYHAGVWEWAKVALWGPLACVLFAGFIKSIQLWLMPFNQVLVDQVFTFNMLYAAYCLLPFPPLEGSRIFYASRSLYVFAFATFVSYLSMIALLGYYSYLIALTVGTAAVIAYYFMFERSA